MVERRTHSAPRRLHLGRSIFTIHFTGARADSHELEFYDAAHALVGFQRSLALVSHLVANGEIITQAPALKNAQIYSLPPEEGGWKTKAAVVFGTMVGGMAVAPHDSVAGNIAMSIYDYVLSESVGVHVDYNKTIGQQIEAVKTQYPGTTKLTPSRLDSLVEKCEVAVTEMHRPIVKSETATEARISVAGEGRDRPFGPTLTRDTYEYIHFTTRSESPSEMIGRISGYDSNTYKGRVFLSDEGRPVPFELAQSVRSPLAIQLITNNLASNAQGRYAKLRFLAFRDVSRTHRLKRVIVVEVYS